MKKSKFPVLPTILSIILTCLVFLQTACLDTGNNPPESEPPETDSSTVVTDTQALPPPESETMESETVFVTDATEEPPPQTETEPPDTPEVTTEPVTEPAPPPVTKPPETDAPIQPVTRFELQNYKTGSTDDDIYTAYRAVFYNTYSDNETVSNEFMIPQLNFNGISAKQLNKEITEDYLVRYGSILDSCFDNSVADTGMAYSSGYRFSRVGNTVSLTVIFRSRRVSESAVTVCHTYYYDITSDSVLGIDEYLALNGKSLQVICEDLNDGDYAREYFGEYIVPDYIFSPFDIEGISVRADGRYVVYINMFDSDGSLITCIPADGPYYMAEGWHAAFPENENGEYPYILFKNSITGKTVYCDSYPSTQPYELYPTDNGYVAVIYNDGARKFFAVDLEAGKYIYNFEMTSNELITYHEAEGTVNEAEIRSTALSVTGITVGENDMIRARYLLRITTATKYVNLIGYINVNTETGTVICQPDNIHIINK